VSAFLGGILFTALLILIQQGEHFETIIFQANLTGDFVFTVTLGNIIAFPLSISVILFVFSAFFFGMACSAKEDEDYYRKCNAAVNPLIVGFFSLFVSLFVILMLINIVVAIVGLILEFLLIVWWSRAVRKKKK